MPNPVKPLRTMKGLTSKQKALVKKVKARGLKPMAYRRKANRNKISVHNPFLDVRRKARVPKYRPILVNKYPHAYDTKKQARSVVRKVKKVPKGARTVKGKGKRQAKSFLKELLTP